MTAALNGACRTIHIRTLPASGFTVTAFPRSRPFPNGHPVLRVGTWGGCNLWKIKLFACLAARDIAQADCVLVMITRTVCNAGAGFCIQRQWYPVSPSLLANHDVGGVGRSKMTGASIAEAAADRYSQTALLPRRAKPALDREVHFVDKSRDVRYCRIVDTPPPSLDVLAIRGRQMRADARCGFRP